MGLNELMRMSIIFMTLFEILIVLPCLFAKFKTFSPYFKISIAQRNFAIFLLTKIEY